MADRGGEQRGDGRGDLWARRRASSCCSCCGGRRCSSSIGSSTRHSTSGSSRRDKLHAKRSPRKWRPVYAICSGRRCAVTLPTKRCSSPGRRADWSVRHRMRERHSDRSARRTGASGRRGPARTGAAVGARDHEADRLDRPGPRPAGRIEAHRPVPRPGDRADPRLHRGTGRETGVERGMAGPVSTPRTVPRHRP